MLLRKKEIAHHRAAFTLMEMLIVVAIIVMLAGVGVVALWPQFVGARKDTARVKARALGDACLAYSLKNQDFPDSLDQLLQKDSNGYGPYVGEQDALVDPWGKKFQYQKSGQHNQGRPDIFTNDPDGGIIGNWSDKQR